MEQFKVDTSTARCRVDGVEAKTERDGRPVLDKASGLQKFVVHLSVRDGDRVRPDQWTVTVAGEPKIAVDSYVTLHGLVAYPWEHEGRHGISLRAEAIVPAQSSTPSAAPAAKAS